MEKIRRISLTVKEKIQLHLLDYCKFEEEFRVPLEVTQLGISKRVGIYVRHVPQYIKPLMEDGSVREKMMHVESGKQRRKVYFLTERGEYNAIRIKNFLNDQTIKYFDIDGKIRESKISEIIDIICKGTSVLDVVNESSKEGVLDLSSFVVKREEKPGFVDFTMNVHKPEYFFGRKEEMQEIHDLLKEKKIIVVQGIAGIGKTTLGSKLCDELRGKRNLFWHSLKKWDTPESLLWRLASFLQKMNRDVLRAYLSSKKPVDMHRVSEILRQEFNNSNSIFFFDDFQNAEEETIDFFSMIREIVHDIDGINIIVFTREFVPFYDRRDIWIKKTAVEMTLKGLDKKASKDLLRQLLGTVKEYENIYQRTKGHPLFLELISSHFSKWEGITRASQRADQFIDEEIYSKLGSDEKSAMKVACLYQLPMEQNAFIIKHSVNFETLSRLKNKTLLRAVGDGLLESHDTVREFFRKTIGPFETNEYHTYASQQLIESAKNAEEEHRNSDAISLYSNALETVVEDKMKFSILEKLGDLYKEIGEYDKSIESFQNGKATATNNIDIARMHRKIGEVLFRKGDTDRAMSNYTEGLNHIGEMSNIEAGNISLRKAQVHRNNGEYDKALHWCNLALDVFARHDEETKRIAWTFNQIGVVYATKGEYEKARQYYEKSLKIFEKVGDEKGLGALYVNMGNLSMEKGNFDEAIEYLQRSLKIKKRIGDWPRILFSFNNIGTLYQKKGEYEKSIDYFRKSLEICKKLGDNQHLIFPYLHIAQIYLIKNDLANALSFCSKGLNLSTEIGDITQQGNFLKITGMIYRERKDWDSSIKSFEKSLEILKDVGVTDGMGETNFEYGLMWKAKGDKAKAKKQLQKAMKIFEKIDAKADLEKATKELEEIGK